MKKVNWKPVPQYNLSKDCFWSKHQDLPAMDDVLNDVAKKFSLPNKNVEKKVVGKPAIALRVLQSSIAQNLLILLRVAMKNVPHEHIKEYILQCDTSNLNVQFNEGLIKCLPQPHEMKLLQQMKKDKTELADVEDFVASLLDIERIVPRLECINFKLRYDDMVSDLERDMKVAIAACEEVIESPKFKKILTVILTIGNFMNCGQKGSCSQVIGFEFNILPKLNDIKTIDNKSTLLKCIVECIKTKSPELWDFGTELVQVKVAARLNTTIIEATIRNIAASSEVLKKEVENRSINRLFRDKFVPVMSPFSMECRRDVDKLTSLMHQMEQSYKKVADVYAFDIKSCSMRELFSSIQIFEKSFMKTYTDMFKIPEAIDSKQLPQRPDIEPADWDKYTCVKVSITRLTEEGVLSFFY